MLVDRPVGELSEEDEVAFTVGFGPALVERHTRGPLLQLRPALGELLLVEAAIVRVVSLGENFPDGHEVLEVDKEHAELVLLDVVVAVLGVARGVEALGGLEGAHNDGLAIKDVINTEDVTETLVDFSEGEVAVAVGIELLEQVIALSLRGFGAVGDELVVDVAPVDVALKSTSLVLLIRRSRSVRGRSTAHV